MSWYYCVHAIGAKRQAGSHPRPVISSLESIFQDPCPTLNGTRRVTMPQVLTRRSEPIHPSSQARSPAPTNPKTGSGSDHPGGRSPQSQLSCSGYSCTLHNCTHRLVSQSLWLQCQGTTSVSVSAGHILHALVSCSAARRRNDSAAATNGPFLLPPTNPHRPFISSPPPPDIVSLLTPGASPHASKYAALLRRLILRLLATLFIHLPH